MGNPITHNREDAKKNIITSIRKVTQNRRDTGYNQRKISSAKSNFLSKSCNSELQIYGNLEKKNRIKYNQHSLKIHKSLYPISSNYRNKYIFSTLKIWLSANIQHYKYITSKHLIYYFRPKLLNDIADGEGPSAIIEASGMLYIKI